MNNNYMCLSMHEIMTSYTHNKTVIHHSLPLAAAVRNMENLTETHQLYRFIIQKGN